MMELDDKMRPGLNGIIDDALSAWERRGLRAPYTLALLSAGGSVLLMRISESGADVMLNHVMALRFTFPMSLIVIDAAGAMHVVEIDTPSVSSLS